jgi:hypothetical protein
MLGVCPICDKPVMEDEPHRSIEVTRLQDGARALLASVAAP